MTFDFIHINVLCGPTLWASHTQNHLANQYPAICFTLTQSSPFLIFKHLVQYIRTLTLLSLVVTVSNAHLTFTPVSIESILKLQATSHSRYHRTLCSQHNTDVSHCIHRTEDTSTIRLIQLVRLSERCWFVKFINQDLNRTPENCVHIYIIYGTTLLFT